MTDTAAAPARRKTAETRRSEIAEAAGAIAIADGLAKLTAKRVAETVGVYPGLVTHYFRTADELAAAGLAAASNRRRDRHAAKVRDLSADCVAELRIFLHDSTSPDSDPDALLWLDALRECPRRPALQDEVIRQMESDLSYLTRLLERGVAAGVFTTSDCDATAMVIWAFIDGNSAQSAVRSAMAGTELKYPIVTEVLLRTVETRLGLPHGELDETPPADG